MSRSRHPFDRRKLKRRIAGSNISERIDKRLALMGLSRADLAEVLEEPRATLNEMLRRGRIHASHLRRICEHLRCSPEWVVGRCNSPEGPIEIIDQLQQLARPMRTALAKIDRLAKRASESIPPAETEADFKEEKVE